jgi:hypothetical protein
MLHMTLFVQVGTAFLPNILTVYYSIGTRVYIVTIIRYDRSGTYFTDLNYNA